MIFKRGDVVKANKDLFSHSSCAIVAHNLENRDEIERLSERSYFINYDIGFIARYKVLGNCSIGISGEKDLNLAAIIEDIDTKDVLIVEEEELIFEDGWKVYNIPKYIDKTISEIAIKGRTVRVSLRDGSVGTAICNEKDNFNEEKGVTIATLRAIANSIGGK